MDLQTLVAQFTALRHEVNLQTRASRAQQEQAAEALQQLGRAVDALEQGPAPADSSDDDLRPLLKTLLDVHDALSLARREIERVRGALGPDLTDGPPEGDRPPEVALPWWARLLGAGGAARKALAARDEDERSRRERQRERGERVGQLVGSLLTGYELGVERLERALQQAGLEAIPAVGRPFDPELMEVVEAVAEPGRAATEVVAEVRRGYRWRGRVFRFAQVRVAKPV